MKASFIYEGRILDIQFNKKDKAKDVINHFINKTLLNKDDLNFKFNGKILDPELSLVSQLNLADDAEEIEIEIDVEKKQQADSHIVNVNLNGVQEQVVVPKGQGFLESVFNFVKKRAKRVYFLYNGRIIDENDRRKSFNQVANADSRQRNVMDIVAMEIDENEEDKNNNENKRETKLLPKENQPEIKNDEAQPLKNVEDDDENYIIDFTGSYRFFIKLNLILFFQMLCVIGFVLLGFHKDSDISFSNSSKAFWWSTVTISFFSLLFSLSMSCMDADETKSGCCKHFIAMAYVPIIMTYCFLLSKHNGVEVIEKKYIILQLTIFAVDYLFSIIYNIIFKKYKGWLLFIVLVIVNIISIVIYYFPISNKYENLKMSYGAFQGISVISSFMVFFIVIFNFEILDAFHIDLTKTTQVMYGVDIFNYLPFLFILCLLLFTIALGLALAIIAIALALIVLVFVIYILLIFISSVLMT